jgi:hypothetical protein
MGTVTTGRASGVGKELRADRYVWFTPGKGILSCGINLKNREHRSRMAKFVSSSPTGKGVGEQSLAPT